MPTEAQSQYSGHNLLGDYGLRVGSQAPPGRYVGLFLPYYKTETIRTGTGGSLDFEGGLDVFAAVPFVIWVSDYQILGGNFGMLAAVPVSDLSLELARADLKGETFGLADVYVVPFGLGWHTDRADFTTSYAFTAPVGEYEAGANDNHGFGMWSHEFSVGSTVFLNEDKSLHAAAAGFYETHTAKRDVDVKVGDIFTLEGGVGKSFSPDFTLGLAGYAQWKVTDDSGADIPALLRGHKDRIYALGPEFALLQGGVVIRYFTEFGGRNTFQGQNLMVSIALPF